MKQKIHRPRERARSNVDGLPTYWGDDPVDVQVTQRLSNRGVPMDPFRCTFACAGNDGYDATFEVGRSLTRARVPKDVPKFVVLLTTPPVIQRQLTSNDQGGKVLPGTYRFGRIPPSRRGVRVQGKTSGKGGGRPPMIRLGPDEVRPPLS